MSRKIGNAPTWLTLPTQTQWNNYGEPQGATGGAEFTTGGVLVPYFKAKNGGTLIELGGPIHWTADEVATIITMAAADTTYSFVWDAITLSVRFDWSNNDPYFFEPIFPGWTTYRGHVNLITMAV